MEVNLKDFFGGIEWLAVGDTLYVDKNFTGLSDLAKLSMKEVVELSTFFQDRPIDERAQVPLLKVLLDQVSHRYETLYISDSKGLYFNAEGQKNLITDREYFGRVMQGSTVTSEPIINRSTGRPVIASVTPIFYNNKVIGLFGATIIIASIQKGLRYLPVSKCKGSHEFRDKSSRKKTRGFRDSLKIA